MLEDHSEPSGQEDVTSPPAHVDEVDVERRWLPDRDNPIALWLASHPKVIQIVIWTVVVGSIVTGTIFFVTGQLEPEDVGYTGAFLINLIGSASVILPVPGLAAVCAAAAPEVGLNIIALGLVGRDRINHR